MPRPDAAVVQEALRSAAASGVLQACIPAACSAKAIAEATGLPPVTCYRHVRRLVAAGLLVVERSAVTPSGHPYDLYRCTLERAELVVDERGLHVRWRERASTVDRLTDLWRRLEERR